MARKPSAEKQADAHRAFLRLEESMRTGVDFYEALCGFVEAAAALEPKHRVTARERAIQEAVDRSVAAQAGTDEFMRRAHRESMVAAAAAAQRHPGQVGRRPSTLAGSPVGLRDDEWEREADYEPWVLPGPIDSGRLRVIA